MWRHWLQWNARHLGLEPRAQVDDIYSIYGFRNFSEYLVGLEMNFSPAELAFVDRYAGHTGFVLDVGANLGSMALRFSRLRPACEVHAFEPSPDTAERLRLNLTRNGARNVIAHNVALGSQCGTLRLLAHDQVSTMNRLIKSGEKASGSCVDVEVVTLDSFLEKQGNPEVAFLKIDVEGYEGDVLLGARKLLTQRRCKAGLIELCPANLTQVGTSVEQLLDVVEGLEYGLHYLRCDGGIGERVTAETGSHVVLVNVAMIPASAADDHADRT